MLLAVAPVPVAMGAAGAAQNGYDEAPPLGDVRGAAGEAANNEAQGSDAIPTAPTAEVSSSAGILPFTGLQIAIILLLGIALVGTGMLIKRATRVSGE